MQAQPHAAAAAVPMLTDAGVALGELSFVVMETPTAGAPCVASAGGALPELLGMQPAEVLGLPLEALLDSQDTLIDLDSEAGQREAHARVARLRRGTCAQGYLRVQRLYTLASAAWLVTFHTLRAAGRTGQVALPALAGLPFAGVANAVPALLFACSPDGSAVYVNQHWFEYTGLANDCSLADVWLDLVHPDDHLALVEQWRRAHAEGGKFEGQFRLRNARGQFRWHLCRAQLMCNALDEPLLWAGMATEIEHQKQVEDALDQREREFRTLVENAPDVITRLDRRLRHVYANRAIETAFGLPPAQLIGCTSGQAGLPSVVAEQWRSTALAALQTQQEQECQFTVERDDPVRPVSHYICRLIPEFDREGSVETVLCIAYDITQRRHAVSALEESEQRFRQFAESSDDVFWLAEAGGGRLLYVSPAFERVWGRSCEALQANPELWRTALIAPETAGLPAPFFAEAISSGSPDAWREYRIRRADGQPRWIRDRRFQLRDQDGVVVRIGGIAEDITERKEREIEREALLERERAARAEAEALASAKDEFVAVVSHELRSPLNAIRGWAHVLRQTGELTPAQLRALDAIDRNTQAQARMVDDLLDTQRLLRSKLNLETRRAELAPVVEQAVENFRPGAQAKRITLTVAHDPQIGMVEMDVERLRQVLANLISNAIKFTPEEGRVDVATRLQPHALEIEVRDSGIGIDPQLLSQVFDRFHQADGSSTRRQGGLGLGLSLARQLVDLHGGRLRAHSDGIGRGAAFVVELPRRLAEARPDPSGSQRGDDGRAQQLARKRIVVVEDDADGREILSFILRDQNAELASFDNASSAFRYLAELPPQQQPDALISDIAMPDEDGYSFIRRWRAEELRQGLRRVPAVALTAFASARDRAKAFAAGFDAHIGKPIDSTVLIDTLLEVVMGREALSPTP
ncbi:hybrid sensor histidine kinase/response regulator [Eleftheria terrae]|uniref:hybrid sensor histidine kinase/response regulator n=1 Tax=Eleftheria terrae TaxID=1597781 RepID=UPI00263B79A2|nr:PAS domain S-box protein [Eleftheria terrae]WKB54314.1 PAS domain S-box protein [Eleftheria terrae]